MLHYLDFVGLIKRALSKGVPTCLGPKHKISWFGRLAFVPHYVFGADAEHMPAFVFSTAKSLSVPSVDIDYIV